MYVAEPLLHLPLTALGAEGPAYIQCSCFRKRMIHYARCLTVWCRLLGALRAMLAELSFESHIRADACCAPCDLWEKHVDLDMRPHTKADAAL
jgi:hypothetical protein